MNFIKNYHIHIPFFIKNTLTFALLVIIGTLTHEIAHIIAAKLLGYNTILHYGSMDWSKNGVDGILQAKNHRIIIIASGVLQTIIFGTIGFFITLKSKKYIFWLGVYLTFFWSREIFNLLIQIIQGSYSKTKIFTGNGDEVLLSNLLNLPSGFFSVLLGVLALLSCSYVVFFKIPVYYRFSFIFSGFLGSILGYYLWFLKLGPLLLP